MAKKKSEPLVRDADRPQPAAFLIPVLYESTTTPQEAAEALDRAMDEVLPTVKGIGKLEVGAFYPTTHNPEHPHLLDCTVNLMDGAGSDTELKFHIYEAEGSIKIDVLTPSGKSLAGLELEYYGNKLQLLVYHPQKDEPKDKVQVVNDVASASGS